MRKTRLRPRWMFLFLLGCRWEARLWRGRWRSEIWIGRRRKRRPRRRRWMVRGAWRRMQSDRRVGRARRGELPDGLALGLLRLDWMRSMSFPLPLRWRRRLLRRASGVSGSPGVQRTTALTSCHPPLRGIRDVLPDLCVSRPPTKSMRRHRCPLGALDGFLGLWWRLALMSLTNHHLRMPELLDGASGCLMGASSWARLTSFHQSRRARLWDHHKLRRSHRRRRESLGHRRRRT